MQFHHLSLHWINSLIPPRRQTGAMIYIMRGSRTCILVWKVLQNMIFLGDTIWNGNGNPTNWYFSPFPFPMGKQLPWIDQGKILKHCLVVAVSNIIMTLIKVLVKGLKLGFEQAVEACFAQNTKPWLMNSHIVQSQNQAI